ncbi:MAG TPA: TonB family protein, partial [Polyangia bacterium]
MRAQGDFQQRRPETAPAPAKKTPSLTRPPRVKVPPAPVYPPAARAQGQSADVTLQIDIDAAGGVSNAKVVRSTAEGFDEAALSAARAMQFEPAEIDGVPGAIRIEYILRFRPPANDGGASSDAGTDGAPDAGADGGAADDAGIDGGARDGGVGDGGIADGALDLQPRLPTLLPLARGRLREKGTRDPIESATVTVERPGAPGVAAAAGEAIGLTDAEGNFVVMGAPGERVRVVVSSGQHEPCIRDFTLPDSAAPPLELTCTVPRFRVSYETVVEAPRRGEEVTRHTLSQPELTTVPGTFGDPLRVIQNLPGVARAPFGLGLLLIRGASPQDSGVYVDGHRVPLLYHFAVGPSVLTPDLIDKIDFYPGGFGVRYGRATAGVVDVTTRTEPVKRVHGSADVDFLDAGAYLEGPVGGGFSAAIAARRSYIDTLLPAVLPEGETVAAPVYWDYQARVTRTFSNGERLALFVFGSRDTLDVVSSNPDNGSIDLGTTVMFHRVIATWTRSLGAFTSRFSPSYGYDALTFRAGMVNANGGAHVFGLREELTRPLGKRVSLVFGLDGELRFDKIDFNVPLPPERRTFGLVRRGVTDIGRTLTNLGLAGYGEVLWDVTSRLRLVPGFRFDWFHYSTTDKTSIDPRIVGRFTLQEGTAIKAGAGYFHQPPQPNQLDEQYGNPTLPVPFAHQYHLGIEHAFSPAVSFDGTMYFMRKFDLPRPSSRALPDDSVE